MRHQHPKQAHTGQIAFTFEELSLSAREAVEASGHARLPSLSASSEFIPVYTVFLRRSEVLTIQERPQIRTPADVSALLWELLKETDREHFVVLFLDTKNQVIGINTVSVGILDSALVHPREVFKGAILCNASSIILAHNHPSGDPTPSAEDKRLTQRLVEAGQVLGIEVLDHIIVGAKERWVSLKERGVL